MLNVTTRKGPAPVLIGEAVGDDVAVLKAKVGGSDFEYADLSGLSARMQALRRWPLLAEIDRTLSGADPALPMRPALDETPS